MKGLIIIFLIVFLCQHALVKTDSTESPRRGDGFGDDDVKITKRSGSGSGDFFSHLKYNLAGTLSKTSASLSSGSSSLSAPKGNSHGYKGNHIDPWNFKTSFFGTIKQAVKAITGGVTAIKGQLIKGSGVVLSASGKVVASSGDKISDIGKSTVNAVQFQNSHPSYGENVHPFHKLSSLSSSSAAASSSSSSGGKQAIHPKQPPVVHQSEIITTYEIPADHVNTGPQNRPSHFSHQSHNNRPSDAYIGNLPPHIAAAHEVPYEYHHHTYEGENNNYYYN